MDPVLLASLPIVAWAIFFGAAMLSIALGSILAYHWFRYAMNPAMTILATAAYAIVAFILLSVLFATTLTIWVSA